MSANYGNISAYFRVTSKHFEAALTYLRSLLHTHNTYIHIHVHTHIHVHPPTHTHTRTRKHTCTYTYTHTYMYTHPPTPHTYTSYMHTHTHIHAHTYTRTHTHTHMHTYTYTYVHTHTHQARASATSPTKSCPTLIIHDHYVVQSKCAGSGAKSFVRVDCGRNSLRGKWKLTLCGGDCLTEEDGKWGKREGNKDGR